MASTPPAAAASSGSPAAPTTTTTSPVPAQDVATTADVAGAGENDDSNSAYGESIMESETASIASSILKYRMENGRTYHAYKAGAYVLPNDEQENDRLDLQHNLCILLQNNQLYLCPAGKDGRPLRRVLDAGTGTGIWPIDFGDEHPETAVVGVDLSPIQPTL